MSPLFAAIFNVKPCAYCGQPASFFGIHVDLLSEPSDAVTLLFSCEACSKHLTKKIDDLTEGRLCDPLGDEQKH